MQINLNFDSLEEYNTFIQNAVSQILGTITLEDVTPPAPLADDAPSVTPAPKKPRKPRQTKAQKEAAAAAAVVVERIIDSMHVPEPAQHVPEHVPEPIAEPAVVGNIAPATDAKAPTPTEIRFAMDAYLGKNGSPALMERMADAGVGGKGGKRVTDLPVEGQLAFVASLS